MQGVVAEFDEHVGLGVVESAGDGRRYPFHCTQIADGSRVIEVGAPVQFEVVAGHRGEWEAVQITPAS
jgi:cold shock CspA family protein